MADLNAKHTAFSHNGVNHHGRQLFALYTQKRLSFLGPDFPTVFSNGGQGRPDLVFMNRFGAHLHHHITPGDIMGSVILSLSQNPILVKTTPKYQYKQANWENYKQQLDSDYIHNYNGRHTSEIENQWARIHNNILQAANDTIPKTTYIPRHSFTPSIKSRRLIICYRHRFQQNQHRLNQVQWDLTALRNHILNSLDDDHARHWHKLVKTTETNRVKNSREFWQLIRKLKGNHHPRFSHLNINGNNITDPAEVARTFKEHWEPIFNPHAPDPRVIAETLEIETWNNQNYNLTTPDEIINLNTLDATNVLTSPILVPEVKALLDKIPKKAPVASGIGQELIRNLPNSLVTAITHIFNASLASGYFPTCFKEAIAVFIPKPGKDHKDPKNYRPISLLETLGKVFEKIINKRLIP